MKLRTKNEMLKQMEQLNNENKKNLKQKEEAFAFLNTAVEIGNKVFCCIPTKLLKIDHEMYQRPLQRSFKHILDNWDNDKCDPITVNYRPDGYYYVIDGQHRTEAAKAKGINQLVCNVFVGLTLKEEADLFAGQYDGTTKLSPVDSYRANVVRGELVDTLIKETCDKYGIAVIREKGKGKAPKTLGALTVVRRIVRPFKSAEDREKSAKENVKTLEWIFDIFKQSKWEEYVDTYNSDMIQSLHYIWMNNQGNLNNVKSKLIEFFKASSPKEIKSLGNIEYPDCGHGTGIYRIMTDVITGNIKTLPSVQ